MIPLTHSMARPWSKISILPPAQWLNLYMCVYLHQAVASVAGAVGASVVFGVFFFEHSSLYAAFLVVS